VLLWFGHVVLALTAVWIDISEPQSVHTGDLHRVRLLAMAAGVGLLRALQATVGGVQS
jgi:hypothetical protein